MKKKQVFIIGSLIVLALLIITQSTKDYCLKDEDCDRLTTKCINKFWCNFLPCGVFTPKRGEGCICYENRCVVSGSGAFEVNAMCDQTTITVHIENIGMRHSGEIRVIAEGIDECFIPNIPVREIKSCQISRIGQPFGNYEIRAIGSSSAKSATVDCP